MYHGTIVEEGPVEDVLTPPYHPYTELLLSSVPLIGKGRPAATAPPSARPTVTSAGCRFAARCTRRIGEICDTVEPPWQQAGADHGIRCHIPLSQLAVLPHWLGRRDMSEEHVP
jgi:peptide/nickel transport system ATP-binding protein